MVKVEVCDNLPTAEGLWHRHWPRDCLFDLWPVRACFQAQYHHDPYFLIARRANQFTGMLALSRLDDEQCFGHFPGEVWQGKTWLEQNKIIAADPISAHALLEQIPPGTRIRYLCRDDRLDIQIHSTVDEIGYLFYPRQFNYSIEAYWNTFSVKSRKKLRREIEHIESQGVEFRHNNLDDIDWMLRLNLERFQNQSYFYDNRFLCAFENLAAWLQTHNLLRVTAVLIGGRVAAVDMAAVWNHTYTVLAGGTHADFPGVAKLINLHHLEWACARRMATVDFLCGEFNWKQRFHLTPRPLFQIWRPQMADTWYEERPWFRRTAHAVRA